MLQLIKRLLAKKLNKNDLVPNKELKLRRK